MLIDKQFARNSEDLKPAVKAVQDNGVTTFIGYPWRFHPAMVDLKGMIDDGTMGRPLSVECRQIYGQIRPGSKEATDEQYRNETAGGGALHYVGCHHLELMRFLMGCEVKSVQAMTGGPWATSKSRLRTWQYWQWSTKTADSAASTPAT